jgi:hypothetical protein
MPLIIWGSRNRSCTVDSGKFYCPNCRRSARYDLIEIRRYFTLYFLPLFPVGQTTAYVRCLRCHSNYEEEILDYEPPPAIAEPAEVEEVHVAEAADDDPLLAEAERELHSGASMATVQRKLVGQGLNQQQAESLVRVACGGNTRDCRGCGERFHPSVRQCTHCGARL